eukprot:360105-Chlamydomonas_euryale.AAC.5
MRSHRASGVVSVGGFREGGRDGHRPGPSALCNTPLARAQLLQADGLYRRPGRCASTPRMQHVFLSPMSSHPGIFTLRPLCHARVHTLYSLYTGFPRRANFHIFCRQISIIAKSTIVQAWIWINSTAQLPVTH